jgi:hypothetical protein
MTPPPLTRSQPLPDVHAGLRICNPVKDVIFLIIINMHAKKIRKKRQIFELKYLPVGSDTNYTVNGPRTLVLCQMITVSGG